MFQEQDPAPLGSGYSISGPPPSLGSSSCSSLSPTIVQVPAKIPPPTGSLPWAFLIPGPSLSSSSPIYLYPSLGCQLQEGRNRRLAHSGRLPADCIAAVALAAGTAVVGYLAYKKFMVKEKRGKSMVNLSIQKDNPKVVHAFDMEDLGEKAVYCRCWRSKKVRRWGFGPLAFPSISRFEAILRHPCH
uniref:CDGSH iron-sulfur domain-containing protein 2 n=1 Tax=Monodelphis domestica TaxID=13616 RepID=A0A5F8HG30_MONDO